jgi:NADP-dependent 3-hydroxy acid dehydrogenase YdfG
LVDQFVSGGIDISGVDDRYRFRRKSQRAFRFLMRDRDGELLQCGGEQPNIRGIGAATALEMAGAGAKVALLARSEAEITEIAQKIVDGGGEAIALTCDVASFRDVEAAITSASDRLGPVDILVNNAGVIEPISLMADSDPDAWGQAIDINIKGVYYGARAVLPSMIARKTGTIITTGSGAAHGALEGWSHYATSKAGALMLTKAIHTEAADAGVRSINLSPGTVATQMQVEIKASGINAVSQLDPSVHIPADWPAKAMVWLCGPAGDQFAGQEVSLRDEDIRRQVGLI